MTSKLVEFPCNEREVGLPDAAYTKLIEVTEIASQPYVMVAIPLAAYKKLARWASLGRTCDAISGAEDAAEIAEGQALAAELKPTLNAIGQAIRDHFMASKTKEPQP